MLGRCKRVVGDTLPPTPSLGEGLNSLLPQREGVGMSKGERSHETTSTAEFRFNGTPLPRLCLASERTLPPSTVTGGRYT
jgi:hypothetical protein